MNNQEKYKEDILRQYINSESIEKAPDGFTSKVMAHIQPEKQHSLVTGRSRRKNLVPAVSALVIILFVSAAFLIPAGKSDSIAVPVLDLFKSMKSLLPELSFTSIFRLTLPSVMMYVFVGILVLTFFDRALYGIFHREK
jgi:hypothetical protein